MRIKYFRFIHKLAYKQSFYYATIRIVIYQPFIDDSNDDMVKSMNKRELV